MNRTVPKVLTPTFSNTGFYLYPMSRANRDSTGTAKLSTIPLRKRLSSCRGRGTSGMDTKSYVGCYLFCIVYVAV